MGDCASNHCSDFEPAGDGALVSGDEGYDGGDAGELEGRERVGEDAVASAAE